MNEVVLLNTKFVKEIITKEFYNEDGKNIIELTNEWIAENYEKISCHCNKIKESVECLQ